MIEDSQIKKIILISIGIFFVLIVEVVFFFEKVGIGSSFVFIAFFGYFVFFVVRDKKMKKSEENDFLNFKRSKTYLDYI